MIKMLIKTMIKIFKNCSDQEMRWQLLLDIYKNTAFIKGMFGLGVKQIFE